MRKNNGYHYLTKLMALAMKTFGQIAESGVDVFIVGTSGLFSLHEDVSQAWDRMIGSSSRKLSLHNGLFLFEPQCVFE